MGPKKTTSKGKPTTVIEDASLDGVILDNRWRVGKKLGKGSMASVYECTQVSKDYGGRYDKV